MSTCHQHLKVPITCKIRVFETLDKTVEYAKMLERAGCQVLVGTFIRSIILDCSLDEFSVSYKPLFISFNFGDHLFQRVLTDKL